MVYSCGVFLTEPSCCYTAHWLDRPPTLSTTSHAVPPPARASTSAYYCPDCTAARLYHHADWPPPPPPEVEPSAPPLASAADAPDAGDVDADATAAPALGRRRSSPPARCYRYIPSSSSSFRQGRSSVGRGGGARSSYFRSMVPGGDAFPVPPPAYDDS